MAIKIITDSTSDIEMSQQETLKIDILPLTVHFGDEEFRDGIDITKTEFYSRLRESTDSPTTSQVTPKSFEHLFKQYTSEGHDIIVITIASELSGTLQSANIAKSSIDGGNIHLVDSGTTTMGLAWLVYQAIEMRDEGLDASEITARLEKLKEKIVIYAMIENLEYLKKGGRLSAMSATIGTLLKLKPIIQVKKGVVSVVQKTRGNAKAYKWMLDKASEDQIDPSKPVFYGHSDALKKLDAFVVSAKERFGAPVNESFEIGITVGTHGGPGCIGIAFITG